MSKDELFAAHITMIKESMAELKLEVKDVWGEVKGIQSESQKNTERILEKIDGMKTDFVRKMDFDDYREKIDKRFEAQEQKADNLNIRYATIGGSATVIMTLLGMFGKDIIQAIFR